MTTRERMLRILKHQEADRAPITDSPWNTTLERWYREGLPREGAWQDHLGIDRFGGINVDNSPRYPVKTIEETDEYRVWTNAWGATLKSWKKHGGVPEFLDFVIRDVPTWRAAKARMTPALDRVNWDWLKAEYPKWQQQGLWINAGFWFGFDVTHSWMIGTEPALIALVETPEWLVDIWNTQLDLNIALYEKIWQAGYRFDSIQWPDDMGYKGHQFFSLGMYRDLLKPVHQRACDWAHARGVKVFLHSCGDVRPLVPDLIEIGIDVLNPVEVKAGMDPVKLKAQYGDRLGFYGGINAALYPAPEKLFAEMRAVIPVMKQGGGYIVSTDHSVPDNVSLAEFQQFVALARELSQYP